MTADQERLLAQYHDFLRDQGLAVCVRGQVSAEGQWTAMGQRQWRMQWMPLAEHSGTLLERFGAWMERQDQDGEQRARWQGAELDEQGDGA